MHSAFCILHFLPKAELARQKGLEPLTYCLEGSCSIQLSYGLITSKLFALKKAGDGNRTHVSSLEGWCSTIELHPQIHIPGQFSYTILAQESDSVKVKSREFREFFYKLHLQPLRHRNYTHFRTGRR